MRNNIDKHPTEEQNMKQKLPLIACAVLAFWCLDARAEPSHGIAMHGEPAYAPGFEHLSYVRPDAPRGGNISHGVAGSFDSLNPLIVRGNAANGVRAWVYESLMARSYDEPFSLYGLLAETIETPEDRSWVEFRLRPEARFSDGSPVRVEDVIFSLETLRDRGRPNHRLYYSKVSRIERPGPGRVRFFLEGGDREMPLILGLMPILSEEHFRTHDFDAAGLVPPVGSGPYRVGKVDVGTRIVFERNEDYWGAHLGVNRGRYNFDTITYDYYRDDNASFEAFKAGLLDVRVEGDAARWQGAYDFPAVADGRVVRHVFDKQTPSGMYGMVFNTRRPVFADERVRRALILLFDFEWVNKNLLYGLYQRTNSYFDSSVLSSHGRAADARERELLAPFGDAVEDGILESGYTAPQSDGSGRNRKHRREALALLESAGYRVQDGIVANETGEPLAFEILIARVDEERLALQYVEQLSRAGIEARVRFVDSSQYQQRLQDFDYDMIFNFWYASLSLGNEQALYWGSEVADDPGSRNYMGAREAGVDAMIAAILEARDWESYVSAARALDRVLLSGRYVIPLFHVPGQWVAAWSRVRWPEATSLYGYREDSWWIEE